MAKSKRLPSHRQGAIYSLPLELDTGTQFLQIRAVDEGWMVYLDGAESSFIHPSRPEHLEFEYHQHMDLLLTSARPIGSVRALHLGAAACALARAWDATRPGSKQSAVEIDALLATTVREVFDLPRSPRLRLRVDDAAKVLTEARSGAWDVVVRDVFAHGEVPPMCAGQSFARSAVAAVYPHMPTAPDPGLVFYNVSSKLSAAALREEAQFLLSALTEFDKNDCPRPASGRIVAISDPKVWRRARVGNIVLAANTGEWDLADLQRRTRKLALPARVFDPFHP